jgi:predicted RNA-binding protein with TRAM domain
MKKTICLISILLILFALCSCSTKQSVTLDYANAQDFEAALNNGDDLTGKTVSVTISEVIPDSAFGYNLTAGEHLNFCSTENPNVKAGETITVKVTKVESMLGSYIISYEMIK